MDSWITIAQADVLASINNAELVSALSATAAGQAAPLTVIIPDVTQLIRGYVRRRNTLGQPGTVPQELKNAAIDIIIYRVANRLKKTAIAKDRESDNKAAFDLLRDCAEGRFYVSAPDSPTTEVTSAPAPNMECVEPMNPVPIKHRHFGPEEERGI